MIVTKSIKVIIIFLTTFFFYFNVNNIYSQERNFEKHIAYINFQYIFHNSNKSIKLRSVLNKTQKDYQYEIDLEEQELRVLEKELKEKREKIDEITFKKLLKEFEKKIETTQKTVQINKQNLDYNFQKHQKIIAEEINKVVTEVAKRNNIMIVFKSNNIIYADSKIDLTKIVLDEFNNKENYFDFSDLEVKLFEEKENAN